MSKEQTVELQGKLEAVIAERDTLHVALQTAHDHLDMESLRVSHCKDAAQIEAAIRSLPPAAKINQNDSVHLDSGKPGSAVAHFVA